MSRFNNIIPGTLRKRALHLVLFILIMIVSALPAAAQNGQSRTNRGSAALHISVYIVPVIYLPRATAKESMGNTSVTYNLPGKTISTDVIEESSTTDIVTNAGTVKAPLQTTTLVPR